MSFPGVTAPPATNGPYIPLPVRAALERSFDGCLSVLVLVAAEGVVVTEALDGRGGGGGGGGGGWGEGGGGGGGGGGERGIRVDVLSWVSGVMIILV